MNLFRLFSRSHVSRPSYRKPSKNRRSISRRRRVRLGEQLETRNLLAGDLAISELFWEPIAQSGFHQQYFEIRGEAHETIPQGTYMVVVDGDFAVGEVDSRFDLSGITLGPNGFLAISQGPTELSIDPDSTSFVGTSGFAGLPDGMYEGETPFSDEFQDRDGFSSNSKTFMLIESAVVPAVNADYDTNNDGVLDGDAANWNVLDAISINGGQVVVNFEVELSTIVGAPFGMTGATHGGTSATGTFSYALGTGGYNAIPSRSDYYSNGSFKLSLPNGTVVTGS